MWYLYRFTADTGFDNSEVSPALELRIAEFSESIFKHIGPDAHYARATAYAPDGSVEVWFNLPHLPLDGNLGEFWQKRLAECRIACRRIGNR
jgi:hypothetical protein